MVKFFLFKYNYYWLDEMVGVRKNMKIDYLNGLANAFSGKLSVDTEKNENNKKRAETYE